MHDDRSIASIFRLSQEMTTRPPVNRLITAARPNTNGTMNRQTEFMPRLEWMWEERNRTVALLIRLCLSSSRIPLSFPMYA